MKIGIICGLLSLDLCRVWTVKPHRNVKEALRIVGGSNVTDVNEFPWVVLLLYMNYGRLVPSCTGSLIASEWVLTAAHCIGATHIYVRGEDADKAVREQRYSRIVQSIPHPSYVKIDLYPFFQFINDIALLKVTPTKVATYGKVCAVDYKSLIGLEVKVMGYGQRTFNNDGSPYIRPEDDKLRKVLKYANGMLAVCPRSYLTKNGGQLLCVVRRCGVVELAGFGDSGGPVVLDNSTVVGINSFLDYNGLYVGYYSHVSSEIIHAMAVSTDLDWISKLTNGTSAHN